MKILIANNTQPLEEQDKKFFEILTSYLKENQYLDFNEFYWGPLLYHTKGEIRFTLMYRGDYNAKIRF